MPDCFILSEIEAILTTLEKVRRRIRWHRAWRGLWLGLLCSASVWTFALLLYKVLPFPLEWVLWAGGVALISIPACFGRGWLRSITKEEAARWVDQREGLKERLSTALELEQNQAASPWWTLLLKDAARHASLINPKRLLPLHLPSFYSWILILLALGAGLGFIPEYRSKAVLQARQEKEIVRDVGRHLTELVRQSLTRRPPSTEQASKAIEAAEELGRQMVNGAITRPDALKELANVADKMRQEMKGLANTPALKPVQDAARPAPQTGGSPSPDSQKQMDAAQKALEDKAGSADALKDLKDQLAKAREAGAGLAGQNSESAAKARQELGEQLANISKKLADLGQSVPELNDAIQALKNGQTDMFLKDLDVATLDLDKMKAMAEAIASQQSASERMGKDLEEQLKLGQAEAAQQRLNEMVNALKEKSLTPEQLQKLMAEAKNAIDPGSHYGKVGDFLGKASNSMKAGDKASAADNLAKAAKELENLMASAVDAKSLSASLAACDKAGECLGSCLSWAKCKSGRVSKTGSKMGRGVGTWADENNWFFNPAIQQYVDNSDFKRPDTTPKGQTDRGDGELPENMAPTKLHGKFNPGGPMPSITLKGVSIKGKSTVAYQEAAAAAQSEAESALNQDQVPHGYQGAVKDYFNDLKK